MSDVIYTPEQLKQMEDFAKRHGVTKQAPPPPPQTIQRQKSLADKIRGTFSGRAQAAVENAEK